MIELLKAHSGAIAALCKRAGVRRLDVFGSAACGTFDPRHSDIDLLVEFTPLAKQKAFDNYFEILEGLTDLLGLPVDLLTSDQIRDSILADEIEATRQPIYAG